jgi:beta-lactamase class A
VPRRLLLASAATLALARGAASAAAQPAPANGGAPGAAARPVDYAALRAAVEARVAALRARAPGAVVAVAVRDLAPGGGTLDVAPDSVFHAASTMKLPVMIAAVRDAEAKRLTSSTGWSTRRCTRWPARACRRASSCGG